MTPPRAPSAGRPPPASSSLSSRRGPASPDRTTPRRLLAAADDLVGHVDEPVTGGPAAGEAEWLFAARLAEQALAGPDHDGEDEQPQLIDEVVLEQRAPELVAGVDDDVPVHVLLQPGDFLDHVALQDRHVGPRGVLEGRGHDVLRHAVQPVRPVAGPGRPARREPLVGAPAEQQGRGAQGFGVRDPGELVEVLAAGTAEPAAPPEALLAVGVLHHSVERYVRADDDLSHRVLLTGCCLLQPPVDTPRPGRTGRPRAAQFGTRAVYVHAGRGEAYDAGRIRYDQPDRTGAGR